MFVFSYLYSYSMLNYYSVFIHEHWTMKVEIIKTQTKAIESRSAGFLEA